MSYANSIGNPQQAISSSTPSATVQVTESSGEAKESVVSNSSGRNVDQATLSASAGLVAQAMEGSDVRSTKVASLQEAISTGSYNVSSSDVAGKIIQSLLE
jgi:negative regulator of flagellin synthesis FlgM